MSHKAMPSLVLSIVTMGLPQAELLGEEPLPPRALARIGDHRFYHGPRITCAVLSPDGRRIASAAHYPFYSRYLAIKKERDAHAPGIVLWDAATGERLCELHLPDATIQHLAFSPDGKRLAAVYTISDEKQGVVVFAVETGKLLWQREDFKTRVIFLQFADDGKQLRVSEHRGPVSAWDAASGKQLRRWKPPPEVPFAEEKAEVCGMGGVLSPDGKVVAWEMRLFDEKKRAYTYSIGLRVQDAATNKLLYQKKCKLYTRLLSFAFSADNKRFAASDDDHNLIVWETATGKELVALKIPDMDGFVLAPDGRSATISEWVRRGSRLRLWDLQTGKPSQELYPDFVLATFIPGTRQVFSADGKTLLLTT
jgi:WD40 repeat protein